MTCLRLAPPNQEPELGLKPHPTGPTARVSSFGHLCMQAERKRQTITWFDLGWECAHHITQNYPLYTCPWITAKALCISVWGLLMHFNEEVNLQIWNPRITRTDCTKSYENAHSIPMPALPRSILDRAYYSPFTTHSIPSLFLSHLPLSPAGILLV